MATRIANVDDRGERSVWTLSATIKSMAQLIRADATVGFFVFLSIRSVLAMVISLSAAISPNTNTLKPKIQVSVYENVFMLMSNEYLYIFHRWIILFMCTWRIFLERNMCCSKYTLSCKYIWWCGDWTFLFKVVLSNLVECLISWQGDNKLAHFILPLPSSLSV